MDARELRVGEVARASAGVVTRSEALAAGMTRGMIARRLREGVWQAVKPGVYFVGITPSADLRLQAAVRYLPAVISHESAAHRHGFVAVARSRLVVTVPHRRTNRFLDVIVHESTDLEPHHVVEIDRMPVTSPARTAVDLAAVYSQRHLTYVIENAILLKRVTGSDIEAVFNEIARRGKPGVQKMRRTLAELGLVADGAESALEVLLLDLLRNAGLPQPCLQLNLPWRPASNGRVDLAYPDQRLIIEADGKRWHARQHDFEVDRRRDNLAQLAGWRVLRFSWADVRDDPAFVVSAVRSGLAMDDAQSSAPAATANFRL